MCKSNPGFAVAEVGPQQNWRFMLQNLFLAVAEVGHSKNQGFAFICVRKIMVLLWLCLATAESEICVGKSSLFAVADLGHSKNQGFPYICIYTRKKYTHTHIYIYVYI